MKNANTIYKKIFNAVNEGLMNALNIDAADKDSSVSYVHSEINNDYNLMPEYVDNFINGDYQAYDKIIDYHNKSGKLYHPESLEAFNKIYQKFSKVRCYGKYDLQWVDFGGLLHLILDSGREIPFNDFDSSVQNALFVRIFDNKTGHDIILYKDLCQITPHVGPDFKSGKHRKENSYQYMIEPYKNFDGRKCIDAPERALLDFNGYINTYQNINIYDSKKHKNDFSNYPIFKYVNTLASRKLGISGWQAYIPALGELKIASDYLNLINYVLYTIQDPNKPHQYLNRNTNYFLPLDTLADFNWSSTECDKDNIWSFYCNKIYTKSKITNGLNLLPMFKKI